MKFNKDQVLRYATCIGGVLAFVGHFILEGKILSVNESKNSATTSNEKKKESK